MDPFRVAFVLMVACLAAIRLVWARRARVSEPGVVDRSEGRWVEPAQLAFRVLYSGAVLVWLLRPDALAVLDLPLSDAVRWTGAAVHLPGLALFAWTHWTLGTHFSDRLRIRDDHTLVTAGPYRWVRHPMYTSFLLIGTGLAFVSATWLVAAIPPLMLVAIVAMRLPREEAMLEEHFGDRWRAYRARTGRLLPRAW